MFQQPLKPELDAHVTLPAQRFDPNRRIHRDHRRTG
jgi:hypothetical protein